MNVNEYLKELIAWNKAHNLVAKNEIHNLNEHVEDSLSLIPLIQDSNYKTIVDIGSGGGFPIIPIGFWTKENNLDYFLIATDVIEKKIAFLKWCNAKFNLNITVIKIDNSFGIEEECLIISRAFSSLENIILWRNKHAPFSKDFLILKGNNVHQEIEEIKLSHYELIKNPRGFIIKFTDLPSLEQ